MRRLARWLLNALTALSLLLCVSTAALWVRSYVTCDGWQRVDPRDVYELSASRGLILLHRGQCDRPDPQQRTGWAYTPMAPYEIGDLLCGPTAAWNPTAFHCVASYDAHDGIRYREVTVPCWAVAAVAAMLPGWRLLRRFQRASRATRGLCTACCYDLTGNVSGVCPECGRPIAAARD